MGKAGLVTPCAITLIAALLLIPSALSAQKCDERALIISDAQVYEHPPRFITGQGWQGKPIAYLSKDTQVYICNERDVEFGFSTKVWVQIAFRQSQWRYGWVSGDKIERWTVSQRQIDKGKGYSLIPAAFADEPEISKPKASSWTLGDPPDLPEVKSGLRISGPEEGAGSTDLGDMSVLYAPLFIAMLLGMIAKAAVDWLDTPDRSALQEHLRSALIAFLVSPIVFLGFLSAGQFSASKQTFIVLWLLAFQNGFFWQTVLKRNGRRSQSNAAASSDA
jgi:hypothetical protein